MPLGRTHLAGQGYFVGPVFAEDLLQAGLVHHAIGAAAFVEEMEAVEFFLADIRLPAAAGDLEGFAAAQGKDLVVRVILRQLQVPTQAEAAVGGVERAEAQ
ncbi:hypothetical protein D3C85_1506880 [compost metagenome]